MCTSRGSWSEVAVDSPGYLQCPLSFSSSFLPDRVTASATDILKRTLTKEVLRYNLSDKTLSSCF